MTINLVFHHLSPGSSFVSILLVQSKSAVHEVGKNRKHAPSLTPCGSSLSWSHALKRQWYGRSRQSPLMVWRHFNAGGDLQMTPAVELRRFIVVQLILFVQTRKCSFCLHLVDGLIAPTSTTRPETMKHRCTERTKRLLTHSCSCDCDIRPWK